MSRSGTPTPSNASITDDAHENLHFDYDRDHPGGADIRVILRSRDSHHFRVPRTAVLEELIQRNSESSNSESTNAESSLLVVLPESGEIILSLLTFIFPVAPAVPRIPSTHEKAMELLSVAQKYQMETVLIQIRGSIARQYPPPIDLGQALRIYSLAQNYRLLPEALQTARTILKYPSTKIEHFDNNLDIMSGAFLYELWNYQDKVRTTLKPDLTEFRTTGAIGVVTSLRCEKHSSSHIPQWIDQYIESIGDAPNLFNLVDFNIAMARHIRKANESSCECASISSQTIRDFWAALESVVQRSFEKPEARSALRLSLVQEQEDPPTQITPPSEPFSVSDADLVIRSSDSVHFRVHRLVLSMASPMFRNLLSPPYRGIVDGLPMVRFSEDSELLNSLFSMLYPLAPVIPNSYDKVLYLLAACEKYEMPSVQLAIRGKVKCGEFPGPKGAEAFAAYAIASNKGLAPEMENAARQTLDHPMTFEVLGKELRLFEGSALRDLANIRKRCRDNIVTSLNPLFEFEHRGPSVWLSCPELGQSCWDAPPTFILPAWLNQVLSQCLDGLKNQKFTDTLDVHSRIRGAYSTALQAHVSCKNCILVHIKNGSTFCAEIEKKLEEVLKVRGDFSSLSSITNPDPRNQ